MKAQFLFYLTVVSKEHGRETFGPFTKQIDARTQAGIISETSDAPIHEHALNLKSLVMNSQLVKIEPVSE